MSVASQKYFVMNVLITYNSGFFVYFARYILVDYYKSNIP